VFLVIDVLLREADKSNVFFDNFSDIFRFIIYYSENYSG